MLGFNLFLASKTEEENQLLRKKIEALQTDFPQLQFHGLHPQGLALAAHERMSAVVINVPEWNRSEASNLKLLKDAGYDGPVLVTAKSTMGESIKNLKATDKVVFLEKPFDSKDLQGIVRKIIGARKVSQRIHRRYLTNQSAEVEFYGRDDRLTSRVFNLSKGGAYLEFAADSSLRVGELVRVKMELKDVSRVYTVPSRIVWQQAGMGASEEAPVVGVGVEFLGSADVRAMAIRSY